MKKTPKVKTPKKTAPTFPPLTDPRLVAFLMYLDGADTGDDDEGTYAARYASALDDADKMLTSYPLTDAFAGTLGRPQINSLITQAVHRQISGYSDPTSIVGIHRTFMPEVIGEQQSCDDHEPILASYIDVKTLFWAYSDLALMRGACLMYRLMTGGAR